MNDSNSETHFQWLQIKCLLKSQTSETRESGLSQRLSTRESRWYSELLFCSLALSFHVSATLQSTTVHPTLEPYFTLIFLSVSVPAQEALGELGAGRLRVYGQHNYQVSDHLACEDSAVQIISNTWWVGRQAGAKQLMKKQWGSQWLQSTHTSPFC